MFENAEVAYRETQYGIEIKGAVQPIAVGPNEAERYREAGVPVFRREKTTYHPDTTNWRPLTAPTHAATADTDERGRA